MAIKQQQKRQKRQLIKWNLISPGTNWCGPNNKARNYSDLGQAKLIDICCREHDHCPIIIESKMTKYNNIYNNDFFTLLLCQCDEFFYECLNQLPSLYSYYEYLIRNLYFKRPLMKCIETIDCVAEWQMYRPIVIVSANKQWIWKLDNFEQLFNKPYVM
uniref:Phospholipase A2 large subunit-like n=1 Tax=Dermatophagoides pteronyssinus TaxID=6956 RepID=A0A6P6YCV4_DERPT|nr:phospholipase A2 large subunit-like [Dermatophagoides pteronyssinus]